MSNCLRPHGLSSPWNSPGQNIGVGCLSLLQGIFATQGSNPGLPHCRRILYCLSQQGSPRILEWKSTRQIGEELGRGRRGWLQGSIRAPCPAPVKQLRHFDPQTQKACSPSLHCRVCMPGTYPQSLSLISCEKAHVYISRCVHYVGYRLPAGRRSPVGSSVPAICILFLTSSKYFSK